MALSNSQVAGRFKDRRKGNGGNMSTDGERLYSYRAVIAQWLNAEDNLKDGKAVIVNNGDRYSITSTQHQGEVWGDVVAFTVSFGALSAAGLTRSRGRSQGGLNEGVKLVDFQEDLGITCYADNCFHGYCINYVSQGPHCLLDGPRYETVLQHIPIGATPFDVGKHYDIETAYRGYHRAGTVVLRYTKETSNLHVFDRHYRTTFEEYTEETADYLCGFDERSYFVSELPRLVTSVDDAYTALLPQEVQGAYYLRQGEWFFVETDYKALLETMCKERFPLLADLPRKPFSISYSAFKRITETKALPRTTDRSNQHTVTYLLERNGDLYAAGTVRHPEHRMLKLEKGKVYLAYRNRSLGDWSSQGYRVD
jgi:hypothetical protein